MVSMTSAYWIWNHCTRRIERISCVIAHSNAINKRPVGFRNFDDADNIRHRCICIQVSLRSEERRVGKECCR